jgi:formylmethanofuran dehydrogenase subunit A
MFCAAISVTAAMGAKLNAGQLAKPEEQRKPVAKVTGIMMAGLVVASIVYHTLVWRS